MEKINEMMVRAYLAASQAFNDRKGVTAVEYGLIAGLIAIAIILTLQGLGKNLTTLFGTVNTQVANASTT